MSLMHLVTESRLDNTLPGHCDGRRRRHCRFRVLNRAVKPVLRLHSHTMASSIVHRLSLRLAQSRLQGAQLLGARRVRRRRYYYVARLRFLLITLLLGHQTLPLQRLLLFLQSVLLLEASTTSEIRTVIEHVVAVRVQ